jgi:arylsulfatase A-like enzyme
MIRLALASLFLAAAPFAFAKPERPNVLFLFTDDQNADLIGALGNPHIQTPHTDRLVREGTTFTNAHIMGGSSPGVCLPSRAMLLTGRILWNVENQGIWGFEISEKNKTLPEVFREGGHLTFVVGKNDPGRSGHIGRAYTHGGRMLLQGMSTQFNVPIFDFREDGDYSAAKPTRTPRLHSAEIYADDTVAFIEKHATGAQPFYAYVAFQTPHDPWQAPEEYHAMYDPEKLPLPASFMPSHPFDNGMLDIRDEKLLTHPRTPEAVRKATAAYYATMTHTDAQIGRILEALEKSGQYDNTIIVFASDNGFAVGRHGLVGKQNVYQHALRVPLIIGGPGIPKGETRDHLCYVPDIYPTLCELAGYPVPETVDFKSLLPVIKDAALSHRDHLYFAFMSWQRSVRNARYKLIEYAVDGTRHSQLFDLKEDPEELQNLAENPAHQATLTKLRALLESERLRLNDGNSTSEFATKLGTDFWSAYDASRGGGLQPPSPYFKPQGMWLQTAATQPPTPSCTTNSRTPSSPSSPLAPLRHPSTSSGPTSRSSSRKTSLAVITRKPNIGRNTFIPSATAASAAPSLVTPPASGSNSTKIPCGSATRTTLEHTSRSATSLSISTMVISPTTAASSTSRVASTPSPTPPVA